MSFDSAQKRYREDPEFNRLVDYIYHVITEMIYTPSEVRDAAMLACLHFEQQKKRPDNFSYQGDKYKFLNPTMEGK